MKPAWDSLAAQFEGSSTVLIADIDCTGAGEPLCSRFDVEGYPTLKYFNPPDEEGEIYEGERDEAALLEFASTKLGPGCAIGQLQYCTDEEKAELEEVVATPAEDRAKELAQLQRTLKEKEAAHEELLKKLQDQYDASTEELEEVKESLQPRIKLLKKAAQPSKPQELKAEL
ncbi:hypothetical protein AB1Y20_013016 [Prymnesium parvum]|uniref:Thioredoxin domain-containing protein n=1 Tax=Prymnesium parvum TaxID=97485 RepID=A0AB34IMZ6_PRYPA|mmetsp:Transcript_39338/g.97493  ORF Transcript_39338/g.97493 Transcript_39338/m.97493 type:complete len:172 (+) Transcript_39338:166-681(+)